MEHTDADPQRRRISENSPLGRALLGHVAGDEVEVRGPWGRWHVTVVTVA